MHPRGTIGFLYGKRGGCWIYLVFVGLAISLGQQWQKNTRQEISQAGNFIWGSSVKKARVKVRWDSLIQ